MKPVERDILAAFLSQQVEMGETEWCFEPGCTLSPPDTGVSDIPVFEVSSVEKLTTGVDTQCIVAADENTRPDFAERATAITSETLEELHRTVGGCLRCPLGSTRNRFVFGEGNPHAGIVFIGEAPGADEDMQGRPFVGRAGRLLTQLLGEIHLNRKDVYICNILKCRPPGNRDPKPEEIERCEPILLRQLEIIKPRMICALGRISGQTLLRTKAPLAALRGKIHDYHGIELIVTYHPAALLRNDALTPAAREDLKFLRREYDGVEL